MTRDARAIALFARELEEFEPSNILRASESCVWRISGQDGAVRLLGTPPTTLRPRTKPLRIQRPVA